MKPVGRGRIPLAAWRDPAFLYLRAANIVLRACLALHRAKLLPNAAASAVMAVAQTLGRRGATARARAVSRRVWR